MIKNRKTFYISGFDPRGAGYYHSTYAKESGSAYDVGKRVSASEYETNWSVKHESGTQTEYTFLKWDDIVRRQWVKTRTELISKSWIFFKNLAKDYDRDIIKSYNKMTLLTLFHFPLLVVFLAVVILALFTLFSAPLACVLTILLFIMSYFHLRHIQSAWIHRALIFCGSLFRNQTYLTEIKERAAIFADSIEAAQKQNTYDEILIVAHSLGTLVNIFVLDNLRKKWGDQWPLNVKIVTLGQLMPLTIMDKQAETTSILKRLSDCQFTWLDMSNPGDRACFPLTSPFFNITDDYKTNVIVASPQFHKLYTKQTYQKIKLNKFDLHFLYIKRGEVNGPYSYFALTAGPKPFDETLKNLKVIKS